MFGTTIPSSKFFFCIPLFYPLWGVSGSTANPSQMCIGTSKDSVAPNTHPAGQPGSSGPARTGRPAGSRTRSSACSPCMHGARWGHRPVDRGAWWEGLPLLLSHPPIPTPSPFTRPPAPAAPGPHSFPQGAPVTQGNSPAAERGWWWPPWTGPGTCSQPLEALKVQMCAWSPSGQRRQGAPHLWEIRGSDR